ncbi:hypothetical protein AN1V17_25820 [Vallitalea sediminicola]
MKKIVTLLLALTLVFSTCTLSYAAENETTDSNFGTIILNKALYTDYYGNERICKITIKGVVGVQLNDTTVLFENYNHKFLDTYCDDPDHFTYNKETHRDVWNGTGEFIDNGLTIIPVMKGAEILIEVIDDKDAMDFYVSYFPFIDNEKTVFCNGLEQSGSYTTGVARVFEKLSENTIEKFPFNINNKPTGIMVVDSKTYPLPSAEDVKKAKEALAVTDTKKEDVNDAAEDTSKEDETAKEVDTTKDTEAVPGLSNFEQVNEYKADTFNDVEDGIWYADSVKNCYELGIMNGKGDNQFAPKGSISVAEAIAMAARTNKIYAGLGSEIEKTGDNWYDGFVKYALENNIMTEDQFDDYTRKITKAELSYLFAKSVPEEEFKAIQLYPMADVDDDTNYASEIYLLFNAGVVTGSDAEATFHPTDNITRAEASAIINRVINTDSRKAL